MSMKFSLDEVFKETKFQLQITSTLQQLILKEMNNYNSPLQEDIKDRIAKHLAKFMKKTEYQDLLENALNEYITKDVAKQIVQLGVQAYTDGKRYSRY